MTMMNHNLEAQLGVWIPFWSLSGLNSIFLRKVFLNGRGREGERKNPRPSSLCYRVYSDAAAFVSMVAAYHTIMPNAVLLTKSARL